MYLGLAIPGIRYLSAIAPTTAISDCLGCEKAGLERVHVGAPTVRV